MTYLNNIFGNGQAPQNEPLAGRVDQIRNSAGGYVWGVDNWTRLERFLILGAEGGTYYIAERPLAVENANAVVACLTENGLRVVNTVIEISAAGRAPKNDPALFVLAMASSQRFAGADVDSAALAALPLVARTASHLCSYAAYVESMRGWGRGLRNAIAHWYLNRPVNELAYQMVKYQRRNGWAHRDLLRLSHPKATTPEQNALFRWAVDGELGDLPAAALKQVHGFELAKDTTHESEIVRLIEDYRLTHEMIPSQWKKSPAVWEALLEHMPYTAMLRHLGKLASAGLLAYQSEATALVVARLMDRERVKRARVHPIAVLSALLVYKQGHGERGGLRWTPVPNVIDALDEAFYLAFDNVEPTQRRLYLALDVSGSMQGSTCCGLPHVTAAMGSAAMAMAVARTEPNYTIAGFHTSTFFVDITRKDRLDRAVEAIGFCHGGTNAALPFEDATRRGLGIDAFIVMTDNETWAGDQHPVQALEKYRQAAGIPAKLVVVSMASNEFTLTDPNDSFQMDVVGFDASVPGVIANFVR